MSLNQKYLINSQVFTAFELIEQLDLSTELWTSVKSEIVSLKSLKYTVPLLHYKKEKIF